MSNRAKKSDVCKYLKKLRDDKEKCNLCVKELQVSYAIQVRLRGNKTKKIWNGYNWGNG